VFPHYQISIHTSTSIIIVYSKIIMTEEKKYFRDYNDGTIRTE
jgi:hypothetical protein